MSRKAKFNERVNWFNSNFTEVTGKAVSHFFCPILRVDDDTELCRGHIIPDAMNVSGLWVPQRKDVDNLYGSTVEPSFALVGDELPPEFAEILTCAPTATAVRPWVEVGGKKKKHFVDVKLKEVPGHVARRIRNTEKYLYVETTGEELVTASDIVIHIDANFLPQTIGAVLKAAHLSLFFLGAYQYSESFPGRWAATALADFFRKCEAKPTAEQRKIAEMHFAGLESIVRRLDDGPQFLGTIHDRRAMYAYTPEQAHCKNSTPFAFVVVIQMKTITYAVFMPSGYDIEAFQKFHAAPPQNVLIREIQHCQMTNDWLEEAPNGDFKKFAIGPTDNV